MVANRPKTEEEALDAYGTYLGVAFQLIDDVLDYQGQLGKTVGDDFRDGKITLPIILAFERGTEEERAFWRRTLEEQDLRDGDLEHAIDLMKKYDTFADTVKRAEHYGRMAREALMIFPDQPIREAMIGVIDFCIDRAR